MSGRSDLGVSEAVRRAGWTLLREIPAGGWEMVRCARDAGQVWSSNAREDSLHQRDRRPVLLVHGFLGVAKTLDAWERAASEGAVYRFSYPSSGVPLEEIADRLGREIEKLHEWHGERVVLVGHSLGGVLARLAMEDRDEMVERCITVCSPHGEVPWAVRTFGEIVRHESLDVRLPESVTGRVTTVAARWDVVVPAASAVVRGAEIVEIPDAGHFTVVRHPRVLGLIRETVAGEKG